MPVLRAVILSAAVLAAVLLPSAAYAQGAVDPYFEFLMARRLEAQGDDTGALAALNRAAAAERTSAEIRAEIGAFHLRHNRREEAEKAAREALALEEAEANADELVVKSGVPVAAFPEKT